MWFIALLMFRNNLPHFQMWEDTKKIPILLYYKLSRVICEQRNHSYKNQLIEVGESFILNVYFLHICESNCLFSFSFAIYISLWHKTRYAKQKGKNACFIMENIYILWKAVVGITVHTNYVKENRKWNRFMHIFNAPWKKLHIHIFCLFNNL